MDGAAQRLENEISIDKMKSRRLFCCLANLVSGAFRMQSRNLGKGNVAAAQAVL
jgi:hypothetical protein